MLKPQHLNTELYFQFSYELMVTGQISLCFKAGRCSTNLPLIYEIGWDYAKVSEIHMRTV
jgi:hypothetical protein